MIRKLECKRYIDMQQYHVVERYRDKMVRFWQCCNTQKCLQIWLNYHFADALLVQVYVQSGWDAQWKALWYYVSEQNDQCQLFGEGIDNQSTTFKPIQLMTSLMELVNMINHFIEYSLNLFKTKYKLWSPSHMPQSAHIVQITCSFSETIHWIVWSNGRWEWI